MANYSPNYNLYLPSRNDADVEVDTSLTTNFTNIDNGLANHDAQLADIAISPKQYGAKGDGVTDDTQAIINTFANHNTINISGGTFLVNQPITLAPGQCIKGDKTGTILIASGTSFNVFNLTYNNEVSGFQINQTNNGWEGNIFTCNSKTLQGSGALAFVDLNIRIHDLVVNCNVANGSMGTFYEISCYQKDESGNTYTVYGMWNSQVYNIYIKGYIEYFCRTWCYMPTGSSTAPWITDNEFKNCVVDYPGYMFFGSKNPSTMTDSQYFNYNIRAMDCIAQCYNNSKNFAYISGKTTQFFNCIPYDWSTGASASNQSAFLLNNSGSSLPIVQMKGTSGKFDLTNPSGDSSIDAQTASQIITNDMGITNQQTTQTFWIGSPGGTTFPQYWRIAYFKPTSNVGTYSTNFRLHNEYSGSSYANYALKYVYSSNTLTAEVRSSFSYWSNITFYVYKDANGYVSIYMSLGLSGMGWYIDYNPPKVQNAYTYFIYLMAENFGNTLDTTGMTLVTPSNAYVNLPDVSKIGANTNSNGSLGFDNAKGLVVVGRSGQGASYIPFIETTSVTATGTSQSITFTASKSGLTPKLMIQPMGNVTTIPYPSSITSTTATLNNLVSGITYLVYQIYNEQ